MRKYVYPRHILNLDHKQTTFVVDVFFYFILQTTIFLPTLSSPPPQQRRGCLPLVGAKENKGDRVTRAAHSEEEGTRAGAGRSWRNLSALFFFHFFDSCTTQC
jgi:hypothetical protein